MSRRFARISAGVQILLACLTLFSCRTTAVKGARPKAAVPARGRVLVRVADADSRPIPGVRLMLKDPNGATTASVVTAEDGTARFDQLAPGRYVVSARGPSGRSTRSARVAVQSGLESAVFLTFDRDSADTVIVRPKQR